MYGYVLNVLIAISGTVIMADKIGYTVSWWKEQCSYQISIYYTKRWFLAINMDMENDNTSEILFE